MKSINFDEGFREYKLNNDENRVIRIQITDPNLYTRIEKGMEKAESLIDKYKNATDFEQLTEFDAEVKAILNEAFGVDICTPAFGNASIFTPTSDGNDIIIYAFFKAFMPALKEDLENVQLNAKPQTRPEVQKYLENVDDTLPDVSTLTDAQKQALKAMLS